MNGDWVARLHQEFSELGMRLEKLDAFILSDKFDELPEIERKDLKEQRKHMKGYHDVLTRRISRRCG